MTLNTRIAVTTPIPDPRAVFDFARVLIGADEAHTYRTLPDPSSEWAWEAEGLPRWQMDPGQGLPALMDVEHNDGKVIPLAEHETHDLAEDSNDNDLAYQPTAYLVASFDTAYGYTANNGASCGDLHAWIIRETGRFLDSLGVSWTWYDETGSGWREQWQGNPDWEAKIANDRRVSPEWGTLGDPDVGEPESMIPAYTDDSRKEFLAHVLPLIISQEQR